MELVFWAVLYLLPMFLAGLALTKLRKAEQALLRNSFELEQLNRQLDDLRREVMGRESERPEEPRRNAPSQDQRQQQETAPPEPATEPEKEKSSVVPDSPINGGPASQAESWAGPPEKSLEETLASRWLVWLGAVALALGGTFFVKYSIEQGWMQPAVRVSLGFLFGVALAIGGEWLRRRPLQRAIAAVQPNYVPPALTAAGVFTAFASLFAAHGLHHLIGPLPAFFGLATIALSAVGLSLLQGWFVALLGLIGAFLVPLMVQTETPSAWTLFSYLFFVQLACLAVFRYRRWRWLAMATLAFAALWPLHWIAVSWLTPDWQIADTAPLGLYLLLTAAAFLFFQYDAGAQTGWLPQSWLEQMRATDLSGRTPWAASILVATLVFLLALRDGPTAASLVFVTLLTTLYLFAGRRASLFDGLFVVVALVVLGLAMTWPLPAEVTQAPPLIEFDGETEGRPPGAGLVPPELRDFTIAQFAFGALFALGGFAVLWGAQRPYLWAGVSAVVPVLLLVIAYWRIEGFRLSLDWAALALALAVPGLAAGWRVERYREASGLTASLGFYAAAVVAFVSLALAMTLQQAWLTVALSLQLPLLAWIARLVPSKAIQGVAAVLAGVVLVRLVLNYNVLDYEQGPGAPFSWVLYGYGVPAVMFFWAARLFRAQDATLLVTLLQAGALAFAVLLVFFQIRVLTTGALDTRDYSLLEQSLQTVAWLTIGTVLALSDRRAPHPVSRYGGRILIAAGMAQAVLLQLVVSSPLLILTEVGDFPIVNLLLLAYAVPAAFALGLAGLFRAQAMIWPARLLAGSGFLLLFAYISLETKRVFQGSVLTLAHQSDAEFQAYSLAWIAYALVLLALGIYRKQSVLRYASLVVLLVAVAKVFLLDLSDLTGLYRVASFIGLGLSLVGIGFLYQRYVFKRPDTSPPGAEAAEAR